MNANAEILPPVFEKADFAFYGKRLQGLEEQTPRWKRCTSLASGALSEAQSVPDFLGALTQARP